MARKSALKTTTALTTVAPITPPTIEDKMVDTTPPAVGNNLPGLPSMEDIHNQIASVMQAWIGFDIQADNARQRAAFYIMERHEVLALTDTQLPLLATMATLPTNGGVFSAYLKTLVEEFCGVRLTDKNCKTKQDIDTQAHYDKVNTRMTRALQLACWIAWLRQPKEAFDIERMDPVTHEPMPSAWKLPPMSFVPAGYTSPQLMFIGQGDTATPRPFVYLESDDKSANYFAFRGNEAPTRITLSLTQLEHAVKSQIAAKTSDAPVADGATSAEAKRTRAARQPAASTPQAPNTDADGNLALTGKADRSFYLAALNANLMAIGKVLAVDTLGIVSRNDMSDGAWNALVDLQVMYDRIQEADMQNQDNGKASAKRSARKAG